MTRVVIIGGGIGGAHGRVRAGAGGRGGVGLRGGAGAKEIGAGVALHPNAMRVLRRSAWRTRCAGSRAARSTRDLRREDRPRHLEDQPGRSRPPPTASPARRSTAPTCSTCSRRALPADIVTLGSACAEVESRRRRRGRALRGRHEIEADVIIGADGIHSRVRARFSARTHRASPARSATAAWSPVDAVAGATPPTDNVQWLGPHGTIVLYRCAADELINVVATTTTRTTGTSRGSPSATARRCSSATAAGTSHCCASSRPGRSGTSGRCMIATRSRDGRGAGHASWATRRTRCCRTWARGRARRSRTARAGDGSQRGAGRPHGRSRAMSAPAAPGPARLSSPRASGV